MVVLGIVGWSGSGKTTLIRRLLPRLIDAGLTVSTVKNAHHGFDIDRPGKDSYVHRQAGARETLVLSGERWALLHELRDEPPPPLSALLDRMVPVDLVLVEGFKSAEIPRVEVWRASVDRPPLAPGDPGVVAVVSDDAPPVPGRPSLSPDDIDGIAAFILDWYRSQG